MSSLSRKLWELIKLPPNLSYAYLQGAFFARASKKFHQKRSHELSSYEIPIEKAINCAAEILEIEANDLVEDNDLKLEIDKINAYLGETKDILETADPTLCRLLYALIRLKKPNYVIETGIYIGVSSMFILSALEANKRGYLQSIDLPDLDPARRVEIGYIVPENLRKRWKINIGPSQVLLPKILGALKEIQLFLHDGHHSYKIMYFEYIQAWEKLEVGGTLLSDDIHHNDAFLDFCQSKKLNPLIIKKERTHVPGYIGMLIKE